MISTTYSFREFIESVKNKRYSEIVNATEHEIYDTERSPGPDSQRYIESLRTFRSFMLSGTKPAGISDEDFQLYRVVCENLVAKQQFSPEVLKIFEQ